MKTFIHRSVIPATLEQITAFYEDPRILGWLTPPPIIMQVRSDKRTSLTSGELEFTLWFGPLPVRWKARHEPAAIEYAFVDRMIEGPVAYWVHQHGYRPVEGGIELTDEISIEHQKTGFWSLFTRLVFDGLPLRFLFIYRHLRTRWSAPRLQPKATMG